MAHKVVIGKSALRDIENILDWYEGESHQALEKFLHNLYLRFDEVAAVPESFGIVRNRPRFRKAKIKKFPYFIIFRVDDERNSVFIAALIHEKRNPEVWISRLK